MLEDYHAINRETAARAAGVRDPELTADDTRQCKHAGRTIKIAVVALCAIGLVFSIFGTDSTTRVLNVAKEFGKEPYFYEADITIVTVKNIAIPIIFSGLLVSSIASALNLI